MDNRNHKGAFWPSYVDIMTTLFAIMLVLFAVSYSRFKIKQRELEEFKDKYEEIMAIYKAVDNIDPEYFEFNKDYLKHIFKIQVNYQANQFSLDKLMQDAQHSSLYNPEEANQVRQQIKEAGEEIKRTILNLQQNDSLRTDIKYLVVIEGQASADGWHVNDFFNNNVLSYQRALKLHEFWRDKAGIDFTKMDKCELVIAGSGEGGVPRVPRKSEKDDSRNQRFLIHIVPVIGDIHLNPKFQH
ncbi:MAG: hypothetical protein HDS13_02355 [Bacteroides sp.]|nr:hypothetical protein [Bacteroides sp.]